MAHLPSEKLLSFIGTAIYGDIGPVTVYRNKNKKLVVFQKTFPKTIPSPDQAAQRQTFIDAATAWRALAAAQRKQWEIATLRASLRMHGYDLFVHHQIAGDDAAIRAVQRQTRTTLIPP